MSAPKDELVPVERCDEQLALWLLGALDTPAPVDVFRQVLQKLARHRLAPLNPTEQGGEG